MLKALFLKIQFFFESAVDRVLKRHYFTTNPLYNNNFIYNELQQKILIINWLNSYKNGLILKDQFEFGFRTFSQTNEDGILLYIFTIIGTTNKKLVEIGINCDNSTVNVPESVAANLISFHGWSGLLLDSSPSNAGQVLHHFHLNRSCGYYFFNLQKDVQVNPGSSLLNPIIRSSFVTPENINQILHDNGFADEIDLFSLDIDSFDYHVFAAMNYKPRVVILETDGGKIDYDTSVTIKYNPYASGSQEYIDHNKKVGDFIRSAGFSGTMSLAAAVKLAKEKGYRLVTLSAGGWNAFFIRNDIAIDEFPEVTIEECYKKIPALYSLKTNNKLFTFKDLESHFPGLMQEV